MSQTRRLAAILAADVAGYSRLMGADEEGTLAREALRSAPDDPEVLAHAAIVFGYFGEDINAAIALD
jgi:adenylate cyclase